MFDVPPRIDVLDMPPQYMCIVVNHVSHVYQTPIL